MVMVSLNVRLAMPAPWCWVKMFGGGPPAGCATNDAGRIAAMFAFVFSWTTMSTEAGNSTLPLTWSPCVCVLTIVVTGLLVSVLILSSSGWPQPGFLVSTTTTPVAVMKIEVLLPPLVTSCRREAGLHIGRNRRERVSERVGGYDRVRAGPLDRVEHVLQLGDEFSLRRADDRKQPRVPEVEVSASRQVHRIAPDAVGPVAADGVVVELT